MHVGLHLDLGQPLELLPREAQRALRQPGYAEVPLLDVEVRGGTGGEDGKSLSDEVLSRRDSLLAARRVYLYSPHVNPP